jgi:hypothetical protein
MFVGKIVVGFLIFFGSRSKQYWLLSLIARKDCLKLVSLMVARSFVGFQLTVSGFAFGRVSDHKVVNLH